MIEKFSDFKKVILGPKFWKMDGDFLYRTERNISSRISWVIFKWLPRIQGNHITLLSFLLLFAAGAISFSILGGHIDKYLYTVVGLILLYLITITDKVDGELARAHDNCTQRGLFYDRTVHFLYPLFFYLLIGAFFLSSVGGVLMFSITIFAGVITQLLNLQTEWKLLIGNKIKKDKIEFRDLLDSPVSKVGRPAFIIRVADYLTFMIYAWTLFFYVALVVLSMFNLSLAYYLYVFQIVLTVIVNFYRVFFDYPRKRLFTKEQARIMLETETNTQ